MLLLALFLRTAVHVAGKVEAHQTDDRGASVKQDFVSEFFLSSHISVKEHRTEAEDTESQTQYEEYQERYLEGSSLIGTAGPSLPDLCGAVGVDQRQRKPDRLHHVRGGFPLAVAVALLIVFQQQLVHFVFEDAHGLVGSTCGGEFGYETVFVFFK